MACVGVLALQGSVEPHAASLEALGHEVRRVRQPEELEGLAGLVLPGGESTTMLLLARSAGLLDPLRELVAAGLPTLATCAGVILLAKAVADGRDDQEGLGLLEVSVRRNGFGRQVASFEAELEAPVLGAPLHGIFIRAPRVEAVGEGVEVLAELDEAGAVLLRQGAIVAATFHPELTADTRVHALAFGASSPAQR